MPSKNISVGFGTKTLKVVGAELDIPIVNDPVLWDTIEEVLDPMPVDVEDGPAIVSVYRKGRLVYRGTDRRRGNRGDNRNNRNNRNNGNRFGD